MAKLVPMSKARQSMEPHPLVALEARQRRRSMEEPSLSQLLRPPVRIGMAIMGVFVVGAIGWASLAPIAAGAIAPGIISPDGSRRTVQHLEGGIIRQILARDGEEVSEGQVLMLLQDTQAAATHEIMAKQFAMLVATQARLVAEQTGNDAVLFPSGLVSADADAANRSIVNGQRVLFETRKAAFKTQMELLDDRARQFEEQISALRAQLESTEAQIGLITEELVAKGRIYEQGLVAKPEMLRLERTRSALEGERGRLLATIAETRQRIGEVETQRVSLGAQRAEDVSAELERVRNELASVSERMSASRDILSRTSITAPVSGKIVNSRFKTTNGVIRPGEPILDIVPTGERLLIDTRVAPSDIDVVRPGLSALVHLTAFLNRGLPQIHGKVREVSADRIVDPNTGQAYFLARVEVSREDLAMLGDHYALVPGMAADVMIVTGERTAMQYLLEPFMATLRRGMRET